MMIWSMMAMVVLVTAFSMVSLNERTICFSTWALLLWKFLFGKFFLVLNLDLQQPLLHHSLGIDGVDRWCESDYLVLIFLVICSFPSLLPKVTCAETIPTMSWLPNLSGRKSRWSMPWKEWAKIKFISRMTPEEGSRKVELKWKEDERQEETHFKALPDMRLDPQRILRLTGEFSQAQLQEWEVDQLMWWSKF